LAVVVRVQAMRIARIIFERRLCLRLAGEVGEGVEACWVASVALGPRYAHDTLATNYRFGRPAHPPLYLRHLERYELGTKYTTIVENVKRLLPREPIRQRLPYTALLLD
jgi:hypothetical protein